MHVLAVELVLAAGATAAHALTRAARQVMRHGNVPICTLYGSKLFDWTREHRFSRNTLVSATCTPPQGCRLA